MENELEVEIRKLEIVEMTEKAENAVAVAVAATATTGAIPIPFADAPLLIAEQITMMASICKIFEIDIKKEGLNMLATTAISAGGATVLGKTIATNLLKFVPVAGTTIGGAISAGTAGIITLAMGKAFIRVCKAVKNGEIRESELSSEKGATLMKEFYKEQLKIAKKQRK